MNPTKMKPKWYEWIPIYGMIKYFGRYFILMERTKFSDIRVAFYFEMYHIILSTVIVIIILSFLI